MRLAVFFTGLAHLAYLGYLGITYPSNWVLLKSKLTSTQSQASLQTQEDAQVRKTRKRRISEAVKAGKVLGKDGTLPKPEVSQPRKRKGSLEDIPDLHTLTQEQRNAYVGIDCEMVGVGPSAKINALARCCIVNFEGEVIYDKFVRPKEFVTDFRTEVSGISIKEIKRKEAIPPAQCSSEVASIIKGKTIVGHHLSSDLHALMLTHPKHLIRDTARFKPYMRASGPNGTDIRPRKLREIAKQFLNMEIQQGEHDPGEDARAAMFLYRLKRDEWERDLRELLRVKRKHGSKNTHTKGSAATPNRNSDPTDEDVAPLKRRKRA